MFEHPGRPERLEGRVAPSLRIPWFLIAVLLGLLAPTGPAHARWSHGNWTEVFTSSTWIDEFAVASDDAGGSLAMILDPADYPYRARVSRLSRTGTEMWGTEGVNVPFELTSTNQTPPLAVASDGAGGLYCVLADWYTVDALLRLVHYDANGAVQWSVNVANVGSDVGRVGAKLVLEPGVGITVGYAGSSTQRLSAVRFDETGALLWSTNVNLFYEHKISMMPTGGTTEFEMRGDGQGGVLFAWYRYDPVAYQQNGLFFEQVGAQRVDGTGTPLWGNDGHLVWDQRSFPQTDAYHARLVGDGAGGAYVVTSGGLRAYGQHLDAAGNETWAPGGIVLQATDASTANLDTSPQVCSDGGGGMVLVQVYGKVFAQRVDLGGGFPWGSNGIVAAAPVGTNESFDLPAIAADGFGGVVVGFRRWDNGNESLGGLRFDGFGTVLWSDKRLFDAATYDEVLEVHVIADGRGGAHYFWKNHYGFLSRDDIYALGVNSQGTPPRPVLYGLVPDAAEPGDVISVLLYGEYLDAAYAYDLRRRWQSVPLDAAVVFNDGLASGYFDFAGASIGAWDLYATLSGVDQATLTDAFGVGMPPSCSTKSPVASQTMAENLGSLRKMAFDDAGNCRFAYMVYDPIQDNMEIHLAVNDMIGTTTWIAERTPDANASNLAFTVDSHDHEVYSYVQHDLTTSTDYLVIRGFDHAGIPVPTETTDISLTPWVSNPVLAALPNGDLHLIAEQGGGLDDFVISQGNVFTNTLIAPAPAISPDVAVTTDGLAMVYTNSSWIPGLVELSLQYFRNGAWESRQMVTFGLSLASPTISCDGAGNLLLAWILDNTSDGSGPVLQTCLVEGGVLGPIRTRATNGTIQWVQVDAQGPGNYYLLTLETIPSALVMLRGGNGKVFYPNLRLNSVAFSDWPRLTAQHGGAGLGVMWQNLADPIYGDALMGWFCPQGVTTSVEPPTVTRGNPGLSIVPNPFNPRTTVRFKLSRTQWVKLEMYDLRGRRVRTLVDGLLPAGNQRISFDGRDDAGVALASGTYFARMQPTADAPMVTKLTLVK